MPQTFMIGYRTRALPIGVRDNLPSRLPAIAATCHRGSAARVPPDEFSLTPGGSVRTALGDMVLDNMVR